MEHADTFLTTAEISIAFVGFSAIVVIFRRGGAKPLVEIEAFGVRTMIEIGLSALFLSLLPFIADAYGASDTTLWAICSGTYAFFLPTHVAWGWLVFFRAPAEEREAFRLRAFLVVPALCVVVAILNAVNAFGPNPREAPFLLAVVCQLGAASAWFLRFLMLVGTPMES